MHKCTDPIIDVLDTSRTLVNQRLYDKNSDIVLGRLAGELSSVVTNFCRYVVVDENDIVCQTNHGTSLCMKRWEGNMCDRELLRIQNRIDSLMA